MRNLVNYHRQAYMTKGLFAYRGTTALQKGTGMCFNLDYYTSDTGEAVTNNYGARGLKDVEVPSTSNNNAFAGVLTQDYPARSGGMQLVELWLPGGCALVQQLVATTLNETLITCCVGNGIAGKFGHGGLSGRGSAIPLTTLAAATLGDLAFQHILGTASAVYDSGTGLTTVTMALAGTALGYTSESVSAAQYDMIVFGGAVTASTIERAGMGVYPVVKATGSGTFTVTGDLGEGSGGALLITMQLIKRGVLRLVYLQDGDESGLATYYAAETGGSADMMVPGTTHVLGGFSLAADDDAVIPDGTIDGQRLGLCMIATITTKEMLFNVTSGVTQASGLLSTVEMNTAGEFAHLRWGHLGPATTGAWQVMGISDSGVAEA